VQRCATRQPAQRKAVHGADAPSLLSPLQPAGALDDSFHAADLTVQLTVRAALRLRWDARKAQQHAPDFAAPPPPHAPLPLLQASPAPKPALDHTLQFGRCFSDHMLQARRFCGAAAPPRALSAPTLSLIGGLAG
jgi:hypothetical protein